MPKLCYYFFSPIYCCMYTYKPTSQQPTPLIASQVPRPSTSKAGFGDYKEGFGLKSLLEED